MEIIFKDDEYFYYIENDIIYEEYVHGTDSDNDLTNIKHLDDVEVLYYYRDRDDEVFPVYYEHNGRFITKGNDYYYYDDVYADYIKDYTLVNLKLV